MIFLLNRTNFQLNKNSPDGFRAECKSCRAKYYNKKKKEISENGKKYRKDNGEKLRKRKKLFYENNKEKILSKNAAYSKKRILRDSKFRLRKNVSRHICLILNNKNRSSIFSHLPYSSLDLFAHLENLFEPWMNWENYGSYRLKEWDDHNPSTWKWQLDHIIPHSSFNYDNMETEDFTKCWALTNLRPFSAKQNLLKGNRE